MTPNQVENERHNSLIERYRAAMLAKYTLMGKDERGARIAASFAVDDLQALYNSQLRNVSKEAGLALVEMEVEDAETAQQERIKKVK